MTKKLDPAIRAGVKKLFSGAPFIADIGIVPVEVEPGFCRAALMLEPRHLQHLGLVHGGLMATLAGHAALAAATTVCAQGEALVSPDFSLRLLRGVGSGELMAEARVLKSGRMLVFVEVEISSGPTLVAKASYTLVRPG